MRTHDHRSHIKDQILIFLKPTRPGFHQHEIKLKAVASDRSVCFITFLNQYFKVTGNIRGHKKDVFIPTKKPHTSVSRDTITRWCKIVVIWSGIDTTQFTAQSVRAASTSKAVRCKIQFKNNITYCWLVEQRCFLTGIIINLFDITILFRMLFLDVK